MLKNIEQKLLFPKVSQSSKYVYIVKLLNEIFKMDCQ